MTKSEAIAAVGREQARLTQLSDAIWDHPQVKYQETFAAGLLSDFLREEGFTVETGVAGIPTAFCASYGSGAPGGSGPTGGAPPTSRTCAPRAGAPSSWSSR